MGTYKDKQLRPEATCDACGHQVVVVHDDDRETVLVCSWCHQVIVNVKEENE